MCLRRRSGQRSRDIKDTITVPCRSQKRQTEPSVTLIFYKLRFSCALFTVEVDSTWTNSRLSEQVTLAQLSPTVSME
jgi:hypothetical protein